MDTSPRRDPDAKNRRSTRIVQAVPLTVTGVDALGRPFQERTSTLIINCQGCRYQSKHYVLKNMWLTFEVPHPETGRPPRSVRARVTWVQRPRTVRELFQIGAELETSGNLWGVAFPPSDWSAFADGASADAPAPSSVGSIASAIAPAIALAETQEVAAPQEAEPVADAPEARAHAAAEESAAHAENNVRVMPSPAAAEDSLLLARQMSRIITEAKQQLQEAVNAQAARAVSAEVRSLLLSVEGQLRDAAEKSVREAAATHGEEVLHAAFENISQGEIERLSARWSQEADRHLRGGIGRLIGEIDQIERSRREELEAAMHERFDQARAELEAATRALETESAAAQARLDQWRGDSQGAAEANLQRWTEAAEAAAARARAQLTELEAAAATVSERVAEATAEAQSGWRGRIEADLASANTRWNDRVESSIEEAARRAADRLARNSETSVQEIERHIAQRVEGIGKAFGEATTEAESALDTLRVSLSAETNRAHEAVAQLHDASAQIESHGAALDAMRLAAGAELERHGQAIVESQSAEMNRRAEEIANSVVERLGPGLIAAGRQLLSGLSQQIELQIAPQLARASAAMREIEAGSAHAEQAAREHETRVREISERSMHEAVTRTEESLHRLEAQFQEAGAEAQARWLGELDAKATETTHNAFEAIFKSAEWYEKKVQTQMQATLERGLAQASEALRGKAGELSSLFATELDHFTRSYVEHAKEQLDEQARVAALRTREAALEAADAVAGGFGERAAKIAAEQYQRLVAQSAAAQEHFAARVDAQRAETQAKLNEEAQDTAAQFRTAIDKQSGESLVTARQQLDAQAATLTESWRAARASEVQQVELDLARLGNQAVEDYKQRLENSSNTSVLASVTKLNQHSQDLIEQLATDSENRIRAACSGVFAEIGESLRKKIPGAPEAESQTEHSATPDSDSYTTHE